MTNVELVLNASAKLGECPRWDEKSNLLYWVDINNYTFNRLNPLTKINESLSFDEEIGCFSLRENGGFILAMRSGFYLLEEWGVDRVAICDPESDIKETRFNDGRCDPQGRFIAGSYYPPKDREAASLWMLDEDKSVTRLEANLLTSNGAAFSPDGKFFYLADTPKHVIYRYDYDLASGRLSNKSVFHQFEYGGGRPDGAAVDVNGNYWTAMYEGGRIICLGSSGKIIQEIPVPVRCPTMVAFGDKDLKTLYITSAGDRPDAERTQFPLSGSIFKTRVEVPGMIEPRCVI